MSREEEYAKQRKCIYCDLPVPESARIKYHHNSPYECIRLLRAQVEAITKDAEKIIGIPDEALSAELLEADSGE